MHIRYAIPIPFGLKITSVQIYLVLFVFWGNFVRLPNWGRSGWGERPYWMNFILFPTFLCAITVHNTIHRAIKWVFVVMNYVYNVFCPY